MRISKTDLIALLKLTLIKYLKKISNCIMNQVKFNIADSSSDLKNDFLESDDKMKN
ncbi:hypothetical protein ACO22_07816 [Paracoccidioides brasiliensis]|uniref:Uncharacterized protein n=1 Tax=Paracoccidioides brasiliensis TaxID=121759 RepID=A0A1D2J3K6_PARBR|nr:hypothetical protein ACO22_07816 [Paracoccidioides brasiliensis]